MADELQRGGLVWDTRVEEPELSDREKALRDRFVLAYIQTNDATRAALLCDFMPAFAFDYGRRLIAEPYVQQRLLELQQDYSKLMRDENKLRGRILSQLLDEASDKSGRSSHAARVSALTKLCNILGMDGVTKTEVTHRGGVMMVPATMSVDEWEKAAEAQQRGLVDDVRH